MILGSHVILYSSDSDADRAFFRDVLEYPSVDAGGGWLIFALPPAELALHPVMPGGQPNGAHELYLMCDDLDAFVTRMAERGVTCSPPQTEQWGVLTHVTLPGGGLLGVYQPMHRSPLIPE